MAREMSPERRARLEAVLRAEEDKTKLKNKACATTENSALRQLRSACTSAAHTHSRKCVYIAHVRLLRCSVAAAGG
jgi:hypothetical protein